MGVKDHPVCLDERRREAVRLHPTLNGIDYVEYFEDRDALPQPLYWLEIVFLKNAPGGLAAGDFSVEGGVRIVGIEVTRFASTADPKRLLAYFDQPGDFSTYVIRIDSAALDPELAGAPFSFKAGCPSPFDCRPARDCPPVPLAEPKLDYLAKDYASFRRLLLDFVAARNPDWIERSPADLGIALVELFAYWGDQLSYFQDAVANEAYLDTCRQRISARRHARLIDYAMHDGRNAWTYVHIEVSASGAVPQGTKLATRIANPLARQPAPPAAAIPASVPVDFDGDPALAGAEVFETTARITARPELNELFVHGFGDRDCCLPKGTRGVHLYGLQAASGSGERSAYRPPLAAGDYLLLEEVKSPSTGLAADADPRHRQVVRIARVEDRDADGNPLTDPVYRDIAGAGGLQRVTAAAQARLPLLRVSWSEADALAFPLCLSAENPDTGPLDHLSVARGNVVPCDHGRSVSERHRPLRKGGRLFFVHDEGNAAGEPAEFEAAAGRTGIGTLRLARGPLTFQALPADPSFDAEGRLREPRHALALPPRQALPAVVLILEFPPAEREIWTPVPHLMDSRAFDREFVAEVDDAGRARLRFGDDEYGRRPLGVASVTARYRIGNGRAGNLGAAALHHIVEPPAADMLDPADPGAPAAAFPAVTRVWQPLPARDGVDAESIEEVRRLAPPAFHAEQFRAVTEADYERAALALAEVAAAKCTFRWTGSWHTVFVALHPRDPGKLVTSAGRTQLSPGMAAKARAHLTRYKLAGYDLELATARYVPLEIAVQICVARGHFRGDVLAAAYAALSNRRNADGSLGFFHPERFGFGQAVYLSRLYEALARVEGVGSAVVTTFERYWEAANQELDTGVIVLAADEIARLDNDPNFAENGVLEISAVGGL